VKTKEDGKKKNSVPTLIIGLLSIVLILAILAFSMQITSLQHHLTQDNLTISNLTHSLSQANATVINLNSKLTQAQITIAMQKAQITNLTNLLNLNESQVIFNGSVVIFPSISICPLFYNCPNYTSVANITLHFNFTHAGYIVIKTTAQNNISLILKQNYSRTWFGTNSSGVIGILNTSVGSVIMPVLPGRATLRLYYYNFTNTTGSYNSQLTIIYHS